MSADIVSAVLRVMIALIQIVVKIHLVWKDAKIAQNVQNAKTLKTLKKVWGYVTGTRNSLRKSEYECIRLFYAKKYMYIIHKYKEIYVLTKVNS